MILFDTVSWVAVSSRYAFVLPESAWLSFRTHILLTTILQENRDILVKTIACARVIERERDSKTAPFTLSLPGLPAFLAEFSILQQSLFTQSF